MKLKRMEPVGQIRTEYWKTIPQSRMDEAIKASKGKYPKVIYVAMVIFVTAGIGLNFHMWHMFIQEEWKGIFDILLSAIWLLLNFIVVVCVSASICWDYMMDAYKIKNGKAWIKSGKIVKYEYASIYS